MSQIGHDFRVLGQIGNEIKLAGTDLSWIVAMPVH